MVNDQPVIALEHVRRAFELEGEPIVALDDITLEVRRGEFVALIGPSGCGKSTLLRLIAGLIGPTDGRICVDGRSPIEARKRRVFGMVFQAARRDPPPFAGRRRRAGVAAPLQFVKFCGTL